MSRLFVTDFPTLKIFYPYHAYLYGYVFCNGQGYSRGEYYDQGKWLLEIPLNQENIAKSIYRLSGAIPKYEDNYIILKVRLTKSSNLFKRSFHIPFIRAIVDSTGSFHLVNSIPHFRMVAVGNKNYIPFVRIIFEKNGIETFIEGNENDPSKLGSIGYDNLYKIYYLLHYDTTSLKFKFRSKQLRKILIKYRQKMS